MQTCRSEWGESLAGLDFVLRELAEHTCAGLCYNDRRYEVLDANPAMCRLLDDTHEAIVGRSMLDFVVDDDRLTLECNLADALAGAESTSVEIGLR